MKKSIVWLVTLASTLGFKAQEVDSLFVPQNDLYDQVLHKMWENPSQFHSFIVKDFTETELSYGFKENNLKRVQTAEKSDNFNFATRGIFNVNKNLRLLGNFNYQLVREKELGYNLSTGRTENEFLLNPNYLFAPRKSRWESQEYKVIAGASYQLGRFNFTGKVDYRNHHSYRKTDPRPEIITADYGGELFGAVDLGNHQLSIKGGLGRMTETYDVMSVNEFINSAANPEFRVRFSNGYGRWILFPSYSDFMYMTTTKNLGAGYVYKNNRHLANINYNYDFQIQTIYGKNASGYVFVDEQLKKLKYRMVTHTTDANYWYRGAQMDWMTNINFRYFTGDNYNVEEAGRNFRTTNDRLSLSNTLILKDQERVKVSATLSGAYTDFTAIDLLGVTRKAVNCLDFGMSVGKDIYYADRQKLNVEVGSKFYVPVKERLTYEVVSSDAILYDNVIVNDHQYDKTTRISPMLNVQFFQKVSKNTTLKIFSNFASTFATNDEFDKTGLYNKNPNLVGTFGIALFY